MMKKLLISALCCFGFHLTAHAQMERTVYQSFEIDSCTEVELNLVGEYDLKKWAGNSILTETNIQIWKASPKILDFFIEQGRYDVTPTVAYPNVKLVSKDQNRKSIKTKEGQCIEIIRLTVMVPDTFEWSSEDTKHLHKKKEAPPPEPPGN